MYDLKKREVLIGVLTLINFIFLLTVTAVTTPKNNKLDVVTTEIIEEENLPVAVVESVNREIVGLRILEEIKPYFLVTTSENSSTEIQEETAEVESTVKVDVEKKEQETEIQATASYTEEEVEMFARALAAESGWNTEDMYYVGSVILNRVNDTKFFGAVNSIEEVLYAPGQYASRTIRFIEGTYEFSDGDWEDIENARVVARELLTSGSRLDSRILYQTMYPVSWAYTVEVHGSTNAYSIPFEYQEEWDAEH